MRFAPDFFIVLYYFAVMNDDSIRIFIYRKSNNRKTIRHQAFDQN